ncbi:hypothetical protein NUACC21_72890 [Scytonema sp. NUACC21]
MNEQHQNAYLNMIQRLLNSRSDREFQKGQLQDALQIFQQVLEMLRQAGDRLGEAEAFICMADFYNRLGKYIEALELIEQTLAIAKETSHQEQQHLQSIEAEALKLLGIVYFGQGNFAKARETAQTALEVFKEISDRQKEAETVLRQ